MNVMYKLKDIRDRNMPEQSDQIRNKEIFSTCSSISSASKQNVVHSKWSLRSTFITNRTILDIIE
ncbi:hypothetical protein BOW52_08220 [Solemya elarraichensis gill symbiont]|uniref:Uncharacterized protein n=1 Tax=Solemya elarraichensis gill symbiont TaxID=1918949 RepID=A0A1T2L0N0_9GAMM|nr:hypothetical protein BOW52_08220 [Solemya elarraichensis gill symbiont]